MTPRSSFRSGEMDSEREDSSADSLLLRAFTQWIDLARKREADEHQQQGWSRDLLWQDDDNWPNSDRSDANTYPRLTEDMKRQISPIMAGESLLCFLLPISSLSEYSLFSIAFNDEVLETRIAERRQVTKWLVASDSSDEPPEKLDSQKTLPLDYFDIIVKIAEEYYDIVQPEEGRFRHTAGSYFDFGDLENPERTIEQIESAAVVDAFSIGLSVALRVGALLHRFGSDEWSNTSDYKNLCKRIEALRKKIAGHVTACLEGLEQSFCVSLVEEGRWRKVESKRYDWDDLASSAEFRNVILHLKVLDDQLDEPGEPSSLRGFGAKDLKHLSVSKPFECGWSWGPSLNGQDGEPISKPYLYFTWMAIAAIDDLYDDRLVGTTQLTAEDLRTVSRLKAMAQATSKYWTLLAGQKDSRYERPRMLNVPWVTTDQEESLYYSLYIMGVVTSPLNRADLNIGETIEALEELAQRGRITSRHLILARNSGKDTEAEPVVELLHRPGTTFRLNVNATTDDYEIGERTWAHWRVYDFAPLLLKIAVNLRARTSELSERSRLNRIVLSTLRHLRDRALTQIGHIEWGETKITKTSEAFEHDMNQLGIGYGMWDDIRGRFNPKNREGNTRNWYFTERVVEALVAHLTLPVPSLDLPTVKNLADELRIYSEDGVSVHPDTKSDAVGELVRMFTTWIVEHRDQ